MNTSNQIYTKKNHNLSHAKYIFIEQILLLVMLYVFRRFLVLNKVVSSIGVSISGRFLLSTLTVFVDDFDDFIFSTLSIENESDFV